MLLKESILLDTFPMSPEPKQVAVDENWNAPNLTAGVASDSESEDEATEGYIPLAQEPIDGDLLLDNEDEEEEWIAPSESIAELAPELATIATTEQTQLPSETIQVWTSCNCSNIDLDADKIDQVKHVMASFTLPNTAIPEWANTVSEEQWKEQLMGRIKQIQKEPLTLEKCAKRHM